MAVIKAEGFGLIRDRRFRQWGKLIRSVPKDINLGLNGGYSITGEFIGWGKAVALEEGQFLLLASEEGSRAYRTYRYAFVTVKDGEVVTISEEQVEEVLAALPLSDEVRAKAENSEVYAYAVYAAETFKARSNADNSALNEARAAIAKLTADERRALLEELSQ